jgi:hypothetical protein
MAKLACAGTFAQARAHRRPAPTWIPAFAGMTVCVPAFAEMQRYVGMDYKVAGMTGRVPGSAEMIRLGTMDF